MGVYRGYETPPGLKSTGENLFIRFYTDYQNMGSGTARGWQLNYSCLDPNFINRIEDEIPQVFPNPSPNGTFILTSKVNTTAEVFDSQGKLVLTRQTSANENVTIYVPSKGVYILKVDQAVLKLVY